MQIVPDAMRWFAQCMCYLPLSLSLPSPCLSICACVFLTTNSFHTHCEDINWNFINKHMRKNSIAFPLQTMAAKIKQTDTHKTIAVSSMPVAWWGRGGGEEGRSLSQISAKLRGRKWKQKCKMNTRQHNHNHKKYKQGREAAGGVTERDSTAREGREGG